jgi:hypothetical protein
VKNWFQSLPFKCNLQRYTKVPMLKGGSHPIRSTSSMSFGPGNADNLKLSRWGGVYKCLILL